MAGTEKKHEFWIRNEHKISHLKGFQTTIPDKLGAQTFTQCTRTLCFPPTTFISLWLWNKMHYAVMAGTEKNMNFGSEMNTKYLI